MAFSPTDPASAHSLWLQLRNTKRERRLGWRSDWTLLWVFLLLMALVLVFYAMLPSDDAAAQIEQIAHNAKGLEHWSGGEGLRTTGERWTLPPGEAYAEAIRNVKKYS